MVSDRHTSGNACLKKLNKLKKTAQEGGFMDCEPPKFIGDYGVFVCIYCNRDIDLLF